MLSSELLHIFQQRSSIAVSAVDDSVYLWDVKLSGFDTSSPLGQACPCSSSPAPQADCACRHHSGLLPTACWYTSLHSVLC